METFGEKSVIEKLIEKVDNPVSGWKPLSIWRKLFNNLPELCWIVVSILFLVILAYAVVILYPITKIENLLPVTIALTAAILQSAAVLKTLTKPEDIEEIERDTAKWDYRRIRDEKDKENWPLLQALIILKTRQPDIKVIDVYKKHASFFDIENLLKTLYH